MVLSTSICSVWNNPRVLINIGLVISFDILLSFAFCLQLVIPALLRSSFTSCNQVDLGLARLILIPSSSNKCIIVFTPFLSTRPSHFTVGCLIIFTTSSFNACCNSCFVPLNLFSLNLALVYCLCCIH